MWRETISRKIFMVFNVSVLILTASVCLVPIVHVLMSSFSDPLALSTSKGIVLWPKKISFVGYKEVIKSATVWNGYAHTILYVVLQTGMGVFFTLLAAYVLSRKNLLFKNPIMFFISFTMIFSGGLIPSYILMFKLGLINTMWSVILPGCITPMNIIIMRTFFLSIPDSLEESAKLDGAGAWTILFKIYFPISQAIVAVVALFLAVAQWNSYFGAMIFLQDRSLWPLQLVLKDLIATAQGAAMLAAQSGSGGSTGLSVLTTRVINYAVIVVGTVPIFCAYPFVQRYFVKGIMIGSIKG